jgi:sugar-specific transcriptional regulator TrmB/DNA-binding CsgD family transcriptional regulator
MSHPGQPASRSAFGILGLSDSEERVYQALTRMRSATVQQLGEELCFDEAEAGQVAAALENKGLVSWTTGKPRRLLAAPPSAAVDVLALQIERQLQQARVEAARLSVQWSEASHDRKADELVEIISGTDAMVRRFESLIASATTEIVGFASAPILAPDEINAGINIDALERGVRLRTIYDRMVLDTPGFADVIARCEAAGEQVRIIDAVPSKMVLVDGVTALLPVHLELPHTEPSAALIHAPLTSTLVALFDEMWTRATPATLRSGTADDPRVPSPDDMRLLSLMIGGLADDAVARQLGLSRRTVHRRISRLCREAGVSSRLQLAWRAGERGWLPSER